MKTCILGRSKCDIRVLCRKPVNKISQGSKTIQMFNTFKGLVKSGNNQIRL